MDPAKEIERLKARVEDLTKQLSAPGVYEQKEIAIRQQIVAIDQQIVAIHQEITEYLRHIPIPPATAQPGPHSDCDKQTIADRINKWRENVEEQDSNWNNLHRDKLCSSVKHTKKAEGFCLRDTQGSGKSN
eukprot:PhM_4_TR10033/c0_g1_i2/m.38783